MNPYFDDSFEYNSFDDRWEFEEDTQDIDFDVAADIDLDEEHDRFLEQQEREDFAQDGYFENMEPTEDGFWG